VIETIIARRDAIGRAYLSTPLALDEIRIDGDHIAFNDVAVRHGFHPPVGYQYEWFTYDNASGRKNRIAASNGPNIPPGADAPYLALDVRAAGNENRYLTIYLKRAASRHSIVGIDRVLN
jgi:hypothetical protein